MTIKCTFEVIGIRKDTNEPEVLQMVTNKITAEGLKYFANAKRLKVGTEPSTDFNDVVNAIYLGTGTRPSSLSDQGPENLALILPSVNANTYSDDTDRFISIPAFLPVGTYTELCVGYYNGTTQEKMYYNRALLSAPLVVNAAFYQTYAMVQVAYRFDFESSNGYHRRSLVDIGGTNYHIDVYGRTGVLWNEYTTRLDELRTDLVRGIAGGLFTSGLNVTTTMLKQATDTVAVYEVAVTNTTGATTPFEYFKIRLGNFLHTGYVKNATDATQPLMLANNETVKLQLEIHHLPEYNTAYQVASTDLIEGVGEDAYTLSRSYYTFNPQSLKSGYIINVETGARIDLTAAQLNPVGYTHIPESQRETNPDYNKYYNASATNSRPQTGIWRLYGNDFDNRTHFIKAWIGTGTSTYTFAVPTANYSVSITNPTGNVTAPGLILTSKPATADRVVAYDAFTDTLVTLPIFKNAANADCVHVPVSIIRHMVGNAVAFKYANSSAPAQNGLWNSSIGSGLTNVHDVSLSAGTLCATDNTLSRASKMTTPILGLKYDRNAETLKGTVLDATKVKFIGQEGNTEIYEIDVTPYSEFSASLTDTPVSTAVNYKIVAWNSTSGDSDGPIYNGYKSVNIAPITDAVYSSETNTITFTRPAAYIKYAVLKRWGFEFYRIELTDGTNVLNLTSALDENGQWELYAVDAMEGFSNPFYIFGEKPDDVPTKPAASIPVLNPVLNTSNEDRTYTTGWYVDNTGPVPAHPWWEGVQWFGMLNDDVATVEFLGVKSMYPWKPSGSNTNYRPYLSFRISTADDQVEFKANFGGAEGRWFITDSYWQDKFKVKIWTDWYPYDNYVDSDVYYNYRSPTTSVYGTGNGFVQATEITQGYMRRCLGLEMQAGYVGMGSCPINFDADVIAKYSTIPTMEQRLPYFKMVFGFAMSQVGEGRIFINNISNYSVKINNKPATLIDHDDIEENGNHYATWLTYGNEDGVAYTYSFESLQWVRTDRAEHEDDPAYQDVIDDIQLCYSEAWKNMWDDLAAFQSNVTQGQTYDSNVRLLSYGRLWGSLKGYLRPYYKNTDEMILTPADLQYPERIYTQTIAMDFDESALDDGNVLEFTINGEPAVLETPTLPQRYLTYRPITQPGDGTLTPVVQTVPWYRDLSTGIFHDETTQFWKYNESDNYWPWADRYNRPYTPVLMLDQNKIIYELYRSRLANPDDYLSHDEMISALWCVNSKRLGIDLSLLTTEQKTKKLLVPMQLIYSGVQSFRNMKASNFSEPMIGMYNNSNYQYDYTKTLTQFLTEVNNPTLDENLIINVDVRSCTFGHLEFPLNAEALHTCYTARFEEQGNQEYRDFDGCTLTIANTASGFTGMEKVANIYEFPAEVSNLIFLNPMQVAQPAMSKAFSVALHGEDRGYEAIGYDERYCTRTGLFSVPAARAKGKTGKYLLVLAIQYDIIKNIEREFENNPAYRYFDNIEPGEATLDYIRTLVAGKPIVGRWIIYDHIEIDLSKTDEELALIQDKSLFVSINGNIRTGRIGVTIDGFDRYPTFVAGSLGNDTVTGKEISTTINGGFMHSAVEIETSDPALVRRRIISENYTLTEFMRREAGDAQSVWFFERGLEINGPESNYRNYKNIVVLIKTQKYNSTNVFSRSTTPAKQKNSGHFLQISTEGVAKFFNQAPPTMYDPRLYPNNESYVNAFNLGYVLYRAFAHAMQWNNGQYAGLSHTMVLSFNDRIVRAEGIAGHNWIYDYFGSTDYCNNKPVIRLVDHLTGELYATVLITITGYRNLSAQLDVNVTTPGLHKFAVLSLGTESSMDIMIRNSGSWYKLGQMSWVFVGTHRVYDYTNPPTLPPVTVNVDGAVDSYTTVAQFNMGQATQFGDSLFLPSYATATSETDFLTNWNIFINGTPVTSMTREVVSDTFQSFNGDAIKYTIDTAIVKFALYYVEDQGFYRGEFIEAKTTDVEYYKIWFESTKTRLRESVDPVWQPVIAYYYAGDSEPFLETTTNFIRTSTINNMQTNGVYGTATTDSVFYKPTVTFILKNDNYVDQTKMVRDAWLTAISTAYETDLDAYLPQVATWTQTTLDEYADDLTLLPVDIDTGGTYLLNNELPYNRDEGFSPDSQSVSIDGFGWTYAYTMYPNIDLGPDPENPIIPETINPYVRADFMYNASYFVPMVSLQFVTVPREILNPLVNSGGEGGEVVVMSLVEPTNPEGELPTNPEGELPTNPFAGIYISDTNAAYNEDLDAIGPYHLMKSDGTEFNGRVLPPHYQVTEHTLTNAVTNETATFVNVMTLNPWLNLTAFTMANALFARVPVPTDPAQYSWYINKRGYFDEPSPYFLSQTESKKQLKLVTAYSRKQGSSFQMDIKFADEPNNERSMQYFTRESYWSGEGNQPSVFLGQVENQGLVSEKYVDLIYATNWIIDSVEFPAQEAVTFVDNVTGNSVSIDVVIATLGDNHDSMYVKKELQNPEDPAGPYRILLWERILNPGYKEIIITAETPVYPYMKQQWLDWQGVDNYADNVGTFETTNRLGIDNLPCPDLNIFGWISYTASDGSTFDRGTDYTTGLATEDFQAVFYTEVNGVEGTWQNATWHEPIGEETTGRLTVDLVFPLFTVTYTYTNINLNLERNAYQFLQFDVESSVTFNDTVTTYEMVCGLKFWGRGDIETGNWTSFSWQICGTVPDENGYYGGLVESMGARATILEDKNANSGNELAVVYLINESRVLPGSNWENIHIVKKLTDLEPYHEPPQM